MMNSSGNYAQECSRKSQKIVLQLIESTVTGKDLQHLCCFITPAQFEDVCLERCISGVCGYPLCNNKYSDNLGSRQYIIRSKAVYDISRRRNFCSNVCFQASLLVLNQISDSPLYIKWKDVNERNLIKLPEVSQLKGLHGDRIEIASVKPTVNDSSSRKSSTQSKRSSNLNSKSSGKSDKQASSQSKDKHSHQSTKDLSADFEVGKNSGKLSKAHTHLSTKDTSVSGNLNKPDADGSPAAILPTTSPSEEEDDKLSRAKLQKLPSVNAATEVEEHLRQWLCWPSYILLLGENNLRQKCGLALRNGSEEDLTFLKRAARFRSHQAEALAKVEAFLQGADCYEDPGQEELSSLPLIDQHNACSWRRNIFMEKIAPCERALVSELRLSRELVRDRLRAVVETLHLTQHNLHLRPAQWAVVTLVLLKLVALSCRELREAFTEQAAAEAEVETRLALLEMRPADLEDMVRRLMAPSTLRAAYFTSLKNESKPGNALLASDSSEGFDGSRGGRGTQLESGRPAGAELGKDWKPQENEKDFDIVLDDLNISETSEATVEGGYAQLEVLD
ncbi:putative RNA polymerase II subunit B1 CTD phosphatase RPAP2 [Hyalella azteca]|uniref:RNA polymerase II subunit B1 CTD phosphatase RPAP2 homolog n=1 Tax=Hyalella azteca TaxID=294128 RepID=A0A8B7P110_HYAAZ|nr:putative RNA polymerase II subunit B1 CTD phosphatase RPAP2 [Hyalella azteca]